MKFRITVTFADAAARIFVIEANSLLSLWWAINGHVDIDLSRLKSFQVERL